MMENLNSLQERISYLLKNKDVTSYEVWKATGVSQATLSKILNGITQTLSRKNTELLAKYFEVDKVWLSTGVEAGQGINTINARDIHGNVTQNVDNRQYYSDSPDVLRAEIDKLDRIIAEKEERLKEKDAQIKEKDAQIKDLLEILKKK